MDTENINEIEDPNRNDRVASIHSESGLSVIKFGGKLGLSPSMLSRVLNKKKKVTENIANRIEKAFGYRAEWILYNEEPQKVDPFQGLSLMDKIKLEILNDVPEETLELMIEYFQLKYGKQRLEYHGRVRAIFQKANDKILGKEEKSKIKTEMQTNSS